MKTRQKRFLKNTILIRDSFLKILGHTAILINKLINFLNKKNRGQQKECFDIDKTGRVVSKAVTLRILHKDKKVIFPIYENSFSHSFWRAQEFSLFLSHKNLLQSPILDFGCGDGSFGSVIFSEVDYGADIDAQALEVAKYYGIYKNIILIPMDHYNLPFESESIGSVYSNSVLEHVSDLEKSLSEIYRILKPNGIFMFTVPVKQFAKDLKKYFGEKESIRINKIFHHRNLFDEDEWVTCVKKSGFSIVKLIHYQPSWFTFMYRMFSMRGFGRLSLNMALRFWRYVRKFIIKCIVSSITNTVRGGNIFVITKKRNSYDVSY